MQQLTVNKQSSDINADPLSYIDDKEIREFVREAIDAAYEYIINAPNRIEELKIDIVNFQGGQETERFDKNTINVRNNIKFGKMLCELQELMFKEEQKWLPFLKQIKLSDKTAEYCMRLYESRIDPKHYYIGNFLLDKVATEVCQTEVNTVNEFIEKSLDDKDLEYASDEKELKKRISRKIVFSKATRGLKERNIKDFNPAKLWNACRSGFKAETKDLNHLANLYKTGGKDKVDQCFDDYFINGTYGKKVKKNSPSPADLYPSIENQFGQVFRTVNAMKSGKIEKQKVGEHILKELEKVIEYFRT